MMQSKVWFAQKIQYKSNNREEKRGAAAVVFFSVVLLRRPTSNDAKTRWRPLRHRTTQLGFAAKRFRIPLMNDVRWPF